MAITSEAPSATPAVFSTRSEVQSAPVWPDSDPTLATTLSDIQNCLQELHKPLQILANNSVIGICQDGEQPSYLSQHTNPFHRLASVPSFLPTDLGDAEFRVAHGTQYSYYGGAMANAIASVPLTIALGKAGLLGSFGAAGMVGSRLEQAIIDIQAALPNGPYAFNLINSPYEPAMEQRAVELYLQHQVKSIEASAYLDMTIPLVTYRVVGLSSNPDGTVHIGNRIIAKLSRKEVAQRFLSPPPANVLTRLLQEGKISEEQARLAKLVPMADDITVEADSGGHTDNRPLISLIPSMLSLRDQLQEKYAYAHPIRVGAAGGISTPESALAAYMMGAAYVVTGSINQACVESGASDHTRNLLAQMAMTDVTMAPAADMFEMGVRVQVLKRGTMFAIRAQKLYEIYSRYNTLEEIPAEEAQKIQETILKRSFDDIWDETVKFFSERDPHQIERARRDPHQKMALIFRWYLGLSSRWSNMGKKSREMDYQIWTGPSMGAFNDWTRDTYLAEPQNRHIVDAVLQILTGAAYLYRIRMLEIQGIHLPGQLTRYRPTLPIA